LPEANEPGQNAAVDRRNAIAKKIDANPGGTVTTEEAAIYFAVVPKTIRSWVSSGRLHKGVKRGTITNESILKLKNSR
jgi:hypothetical protein